MKINFFTIFFIIISFFLHGCASNKQTKQQGAAFKVVKVNRYLRMNTLQGKGFDIIGQKKPRAIGKNDFSLDYDNRGEEIIVIWKYKGPALQNAPLKLCFDYSYPNDEKIFRVEEKYSSVVPGRYVFKFRNTGDDYYSKGAIESWRIILYYDDQIVAQKKSSFFGKS